MIYLSSDLHICHDKEFIYKYRGFNTIELMNEAIIKNQNEIVKADDDYYICGDATLGSIDIALPYLKRLNGHIHVIRGNHDTNNRIEVYKSLGWEVHDALYLNYNKLHFLFISLSYNNK